MVAFCGAVTLLLLKTSDRSLARTAKPLGLAALGILVVMGSLSLTKSWAQNPEGYTAIDGVWMYIAGPIATFDYAIYHPEAFRDQPAVVFAQVLTPLSELHLIRYQTFQEKEGSKLDKFVYVPFPGNVYTAYKPYYEDFGLTGCLIAFGSFGLIEGYLFFRAVRGNRYAIFFFAYLAGALMFTTFDDNYHAFSRHLNILIFALGYFWLMKRKRVRL
jgi:oligosaccharide repeat unit polymerase